MQVRQNAGVVFLICAVGFEGGLFYSNARFSWFGLNNYAWAGFFGFGIPIALQAAGVAVLWQKASIKLQYLAAWVCIWSAFVWAVGLFITVGHWVGLVSFHSPSSVSSWSAVGSFFAFTVPMIITGGAGIGMLEDISRNDSGA